MPSLYSDLDHATRECPITLKTYIPAHRVDEIITAEAIKHAVLRSRWSKIRVLLCSRSFEKEVKEAKKVIAIIALIDKLNEESIRHLAANGLKDGDLPLPKDGDALRLSFPTWTDAAIGLFLRNQWTVLAPILNFDTGRPTKISLDENCGLEFSSCEQRDVTQFSQVYEAEMPRVMGREAVRIAVKQFPKKNFKNYEQEKDNLAEIYRIDNPHLIKHLATCDQVPCIIFPWADNGDLNDFWEAKSAASKQNLDVFSWCLEQLVGIASALKDLHSINCRHGDLKPSNILYFKGSGTGILKIADLGVSRVHNKETDLREGVTATTASTRVYEAPEAYRPNQTKSPRSRTYDCWSMGCIILEFVIWLLYDNRALLCFQGARDTEWHGYYRPKAPMTDSDGEASEWWNMIERHPVVDEAITLLRDDARLKGTALEKLVNLVDSGLLKIKPKDRLQAAGINKEFQRLLAQFKNGQIPMVNDGPIPPVPLIFSKLPPKRQETTSQALHSTQRESTSAMAVG